MLPNKLKIALCSLLVAVAGSANAGVITTLFAANNGGDSGGANYFDLTVLNPGGIRIEKLSVNTTVTIGSSINLQVFTRSGTANGFQNTLVGWSLASLGSGTAAGSNIGSLIDIADFVLGPGLTGFALDAVDFNFRYTNGTGSNQSYSNGDLALSFGTATNESLGASVTTVFNPRVANITIEYSVLNNVPEPASLALVGLAIAGIGFTRRKSRQA